MPAKLPLFPDPPVAIDAARTIGGMRVHSAVGRFQAPRVVVRIPPGGVSGADQVIADRESYIQA